MDKKIKMIILTVLVAVAGVMVFLISSRVTEKKQVAEQIKKLPDFEFKTIKNTTVSNRTIKANTPLAFIFFNTECDYCHFEIREIKKNIEKFKDYQIFMVSAEDTSKIADFVKVYDLDKYEQIQVLKDSDGRFYKFFGASVVPSIYIYNRNYELVKNYKGEVKIDAILNAIES